MQSCGSAGCWCWIGSAVHVYRVCGVCVECVECVECLECRDRKVKRHGNDFDVLRFPEGGKKRTWSGKIDSTFTRSFILVLSSTQPTGAPCASCTPCTPRGVSFFLCSLTCREGARVDKEPFPQFPFHSFYHFLEFRGRRKVLLRHECLIAFVPGFRATGGWGGSNKK